jgi:hypothetical protein
MKDTEITASILIRSILEAKHVPDSVVEMAIIGIRRLAKESRLDISSMEINTAFTWSDTKEGRLFWSYVNGATKGRIYSPRAWEELMEIAKNHLYKTPPPKSSGLETCNCEMCVEF